MMKAYCVAAAVATLGLGTSAFADESSSPVEINGYFDLYYQTSSQAHPAVVTPAPTSGPYMLEGRAFDRVTDQMTVNMVELSAKKKMGKTAFRLDAAFGEMVDVLANSGPTAAAMGTNSPNPGANEPTRNITQATVSYALQDNLNVTVGKFYSPMGFEVTKAKDNWQYSRSYTFNFGVPFWHQGLNVAYEAIPKKLTATAYVLNAWDGRMSAASSRTPSLGLAINTTPIDPLVLNFVVIEAPQSGSGNGQRLAYEANATYAFTPAFSFAVDGVWGTLKTVSGGADTKWNGVTVYAKAVFGSYTLSPRYEMYDDSESGATTAVGSLSARQKLTSFTFANNFDMGDGLESRLEFRTDKSDVNTYFKDSAGAATDKQDSVTLAFLYAF